MKNYFFIFLLVSSGLSLHSQHQNLDSLMANGEYALVIKQAQKLTQPIQKKDQLILAKAYINVGNTQKAIQIYEQNLKAGDNVSDFYSYGKILLNQNQPQKADSIFAYLQSQNPKNAEYVYRSALAKQKLNKEDYKETLYKAYDLQPNHLLVIYELAKEELKQDNYAVAARVASQGLRIDPENTALLSIQGQAFYKRGDWSKSIASFLKLKNLTTAPLFIEKRLAKAYVKLRKYPKALEHYEACLAIEPKDFQLLEDAAEVAVFCEENQKAERYITQAYALKDVSRYKQNYIFATVFLQKEDFEKAIGFFNDCLEEMPLHEKASYGLANAKDRYYADKQEILEAYQDYMKKFPKGKYYDLAKYRAKELKKEIFLAEK